jgi:hypothetical protein
VEPPVAEGVDGLLGERCGAGLQPHQRRVATTTSIVCQTC